MAFSFIRGSLEKAGAPEKKRSAADYGLILGGKRNIHVAVPLRFYKRGGDKKSGIPQEKYLEIPERVFCSV
jgi:hypothetical protein